MKSRNSVTLRFPPDTYRRLRLYAFLADLSMNDVILHAARASTSAPHRASRPLRGEPVTGARERTCVRLPDADHEHFCQEARRHACSLNAFMTQAVHDFLSEPARAGALTRAMRTLDSLPPL